MLYLADITVPKRIQSKLEYLEPNQNNKLKHNLRLMNYNSFTAITIYACPINLRRCLAMTYDFDFVLLLTIISTKDNISCMQQLCIKIIFWSALIISQVLSICKHINPTIPSHNLNVKKGNQKIYISASQQSAKKNIK